MDEKFVVHLNDAITGSMQGGKGTFHLFIDEETCGAKQFSFLMNTLQRGTITASHRHEEESCIYILSGRCRVSIENKSFELGSQTAVFFPAQTMHKIDVCSDEDLTYIMIYAPPGPEKSLKIRGEYDFYPREISS